MILKNIIKNLIWVGAVFTMAALIVTPSILSEANASDLTTKTHPKIKGYPVKFDYIGRLYQITGNSVVVGDTYYKLTSKTAYHMPFGRVKSIRSFKEGYLVGMIVGDDYKILSIWLLEKN